MSLRTCMKSLLSTIVNEKRKMLIIKMAYYKITYIVYIQCLPTCKYKRKYSCIFQTTYFHFIYLICLSQLLDKVAMDLTRWIEGLNQEIWDALKLLYTCQNWQNIYFLQARRSHISQLWCNYIVISQLSKSIVLKNDLLKYILKNFLNILTENIS